MKNDCKHIKDSYKNYMSVEDDDKEVIAKQIIITAKSFILNKGDKLDDWLRIFADEDIVISKLNEL